MIKTVQQVVFGLVTLLATAAGDLQAQVTYDALYHYGVLGRDVQTQFLFPNQKMSISWVSSTLLNNRPAGTQFTGSGANGGLDNLTIYGIPTVSGVFSFTAEYTDGGTGPLHYVLFSDAAYFDAYQYYVQQRDQSANEIDETYWDALAGYALGIGLDDEGLALYLYYYAFADYYYLTTVNQDPPLAAYYRYYYQGLGSYYYFVGQGDQESADLVFYYYVGLANQALFGG